MTLDCDQIKAARIILKDAAAKRARFEWANKPADSDALSTRQLTQEIINNGNEDSLKSLANYFGVHIEPRKDKAPKNSDGSYTSTIGDGSVITVKVTKVG